MLVSRAGQALTLLSLGLIAFATLSPSAGATPISDKMVHFLLFLPLGLGGALWTAGFSGGVLTRARFAVLGLVLLAATMTEVLQWPIETRSPSLGDWYADAAGGTAGVILGALIGDWARWRNRP